MPHAADDLQRSIDATGSIAAVGLDPRPALLPPALVQQALAAHGDTRTGVAAAFLAFNRGLIDAVAGRCCALKPQLACYEAYGADGLRCLEETVAHARARGIPVIADGKRNDIGSTAEHYQQGFLGAAPGLAGASVPGLGAQWGQGRRGACGLTDLGAVVGATWPEQARSLRALMPDTLFLVPGYGAQGGSAADALAGLRPDGRGVVVNNSRSIIAAWQKDKAADWQGAARAALEAMNADLASAR
jgi:orotidine-5'-phosphate decarboxylase